MKTTRSLKRITRSKRITGIQSKTETEIYSGIQIWINKKKTTKVTRKNVDFISSSIQLRLRHFRVYIKCIFYLTDEKSCKNIILKYLCGAGKQDEDEDEKLKEHMAKVAELQQDKMAAVCLNIGLVVILMIGAFLYFFWSFWRYEP